VSFLSSGAGLYTLGALLSNQLGDQGNVTKYVGKVMEYYPLCFAEDVEYELLHGLAGYLYCLLII